VAIRRVVDSLIDWVGRDFESPALVATGIAGGHGVEETALRGLGDPLLDGVFPRWLAREVSPGAVLLWAEIHYQSTLGNRRPTRAELGCAGHSVRTVERLLAELVRARALTIVRAAGASNEYTTHVRPFLAAPSAPIRREPTRDKNVAPSQGNSALEPATEMSPLAAAGVLA
jgi:hypothetical protein